MLPMAGLTLHRCTGCAEPGGSSTLIFACCACRPNLRLHEGDAADFVKHLADQVQSQAASSTDLVIIDAFDGSDKVPKSLCTPGQQMRLCLLSSWPQSVSLLATST